MASSPRVLIYILRRDLRLRDNPIFHEISKLASQSHVPFTHLLPVYIFSANQIEVSGFLAPGQAKSPYPEARSPVGGFWRCGHHRAKFLAEGLWDLKTELEKAGSSLHLRVGLVSDVVRDILEKMGKQVGEVWMTSEEGVEEKREERSVRKAADEAGIKLKLWKDEKYLIDDDDIPFRNPKQLPDVFTDYRKMVEPLRAAPRKVLPTPKALPPLPAQIPPQASPFEIPSTLETLIETLHKPLDPSLGLRSPPQMPEDGVKSAHPFTGGSSSGHARIIHLLKNGSMTGYKDTRNGLLGLDFSSKLSAWLALGFVTAREVHSALVAFEDGRLDECKGAEGYGKGENKGTGWMRFELLWRDYMRLCTRKFGPRLFRASGFRQDEQAKWTYDKQKLARWLEGTTGTGLVDASMRELYLTGWTSNRARQNVASYLSKHIGLDWRLGAEWYECALVDYDVSSNWGNWQYVAGVGNDPREGGGGRKFNPVKQADDYDPKGEYIAAWIPQLRGLQPEEIFQCWKAGQEEKKRRGLSGSEMAESPLVKINYNVRRGGGGGRGRGGSRGRGGRGR